MRVTLRETLMLDIFRNFKLVAGSAGLEKVVTRIGLLDHEMINPIKGQFVEGEFALSTLLAAKDKPSLIYDSVAYLIESGASGLGVKDIYFKNLPEAVLTLANEEGFPIFIFDNSVYFEDVITEFKAFIDAIEVELSTAELIARVLESADAEALTKVYRRCFEEDHSPYRVLYIRNRNADFESSSLFLKGHSMMRRLSVVFCGNYHEGLLVIVKGIHEDERLQLLIDGGLTSEMGYYYGESGLYEGADWLKHAFEESIMNVRVADIENCYAVTSNQRGLYELILTHRDAPDFQRYRNAHVLPLKTYDEENGSNLLETVIYFVKNEGQIKATATHMMQHSNTIRYRISKVRKLLHIAGSDTVLYERLSIAVKLYLLEQLTY